MIPMTSAKRTCFNHLLIVILLLISCSAENKVEKQEPSTASMDGSILEDSGIPKEEGASSSGNLNWYDDDDEDSGLDLGANFSSGEGNGSSGKVCAGERVKPTPIEFEEEIEVYVPVEVPQPIAIYIMLDKSGSMEDLVINATGEEISKWQAAIDSLIAFVNEPASEYISVALQYFPINLPANPNDTNINCDGSEYIIPAVPMGPLPNNTELIENSLNSQIPDGTTPIEGALYGLTGFCEQYQRDNADTRCIGVLVTDGEPQACEKDYDILADIAGDAYDDSDVKTFAVGMEGADFKLLDKIAMLSVTDCDPVNPPNYSACDVSSGSSLLDALEAIREYATEISTDIQKVKRIETKILECEWSIPDPPAGEIFDRDLVNVEFTSPGEDIISLERAPSEDDCSKSQDGWAWYYDNPENPEKIRLCPETCSVVTNTEAGRVDIILGCEVKEMLL